MEYKLCGFLWFLNYNFFAQSTQGSNVYNLILYKAKRRTEPTGHCVQRFLYLGFKFIPAAQHSADITASWHIRCQFTPDLADDTGNGSTAAFAVFIPYSLVNLAGWEYPARVTSQICKNCKFMVSQSDKLPSAGYCLLLQPDFQICKRKNVARERPASYSQALNDKK